MVWTDLVTAIVGYVAMGCAAGIMMLTGVLRSRLSMGASWVGIAYCAGSVVISFVSAALLVTMAVIQRDAAAMLRDDRSVQYVSPDWGQGLAPEMRTEISSMVARQQYVVTGVLGNHIDMSGRFRLYELTDEDQRARIAFVARVRLVERSAVVSVILALGVLLMPWVALVIGVYKRAGSLSRAMIGTPGRVPRSDVHVP